MSWWKAITFPVWLTAAVVFLYGLMKLSVAAILLAGLIPVVKLLWDEFNRNFPDDGGGGIGPPSPA